MNMYDMVKRQCGVKLVVRNMFFNTPQLSVRFIKCVRFCLKNKGFVLNNKLLLNSNSKTERTEFFTCKKFDQDFFIRYFFMFKIWSYFEFHLKYIFCNPFLLKNPMYFCFVNGFPFVGWNIFFCCCWLLHILCSI